MKFESIQWLWSHIQYGYQFLDPETLRCKHRFMQRPLTYVTRGCMASVRKWSTAADHLVSVVTHPIRVSISGKRSQGKHELAIGILVQ